MKTVYIGHTLNYETAINAVKTRLQLEKRTQLTVTTIYLTSSVICYTLQMFNKHLFFFIPKLAF